MGIGSFFGHDLRKRSCAPHHLASLALLQLHIMNERADGNFSNGKRITGLKLRFSTCHNNIACLQAHWRQYIALLPVSVVHQGDAGRPVRVILDRGNSCWNVPLVPFKIYNPVHPLVSAANITRRNPAITVSAAGPFQGYQQALLRLVSGDVFKR